MAKVKLRLLGTAITAYAAGTRLMGFELAAFLFVAGLGQGLGMSPLVGTVIANLRAREAGAAAGVVSTTLQIGSALVIALMGLVFSSSWDRLGPARRMPRRLRKCFPPARLSCWSRRGWCANCR